MNIFKAGCGGKKGGCNLPNNKIKTITQIYLFLYLFDKLKENRNDKIR